MSEHLLQPIDLYCERLSSALWAEPANAISNIAFPLVATVVWHRTRGRGTIPPDLLVLILLAGCIGVGSFLFHTFANGWSELADVIPIWSFVGLYVIVAIKVISGVTPRWNAYLFTCLAVILTVYLATGSGPKATPAPLNGSLQYVPAVIALVILSSITLLRRHPITPWASAATVVFMISLAFRTLDPALCPTYPLGTHFLWHILNASMIGLLLHGLATAYQAREVTEGRT